MAEQDAPNKAPGTHQVEDQRPEDRRTDSRASHEAANRYDESSGGDAGISNRPLDEELANQDALPERGDTKKT